MKLLFRDISAPNCPPPSAGELYVHPIPAERRYCRMLALLVVEHKVASLVQGAAPIETIVVRADPSFDDLLAACFAGELLAARPLPAAAENFARYAAMVREGMMPGSVPLENSMQGMFRAIRSAAGDDLTDADSAQLFADDWARMARSILKAAAAGENPLTTSPFADEAEFERERIFLNNDHELYRQDMQRGEQWIVEIPDGPRSARALLLRRPKSLLYMYWSRSEHGSGIDRPFAFLAVEAKAGEWIFSTDPVKKLRIESLAQRLQAEEEKINPRAKDDPWFDGKPFGHTMVAAPRGCTQLPDRTVLATVRQWSHARTVRAPVSWRLPAAALAALVLLGVVILSPPKPPVPNPTPGPDPTHGQAPLTHGQGDPAIDLALGPPLPAGGKNYALIFATDTYKYQQTVNDLGHVVQPGWGHLNNPVNDAKALGTVLEQQYGFAVKEFDNQSQLDIENVLHDWYNRTYYGQQSELLIYFTGHGYLDPITKRPFIVAADSLYDGTPVGIEHTCISLDQLADSFPTMPCQHILLMLDTCYAGTIDYGIALSKPKGDDMPIGTSQYVEMQLKPESRLCLASTGNADSYDGTGQHSPFAQRILDYFTLEKKAPIVNINMLYDDLLWLKIETPHYSELRGNAGGGTFLFVNQATGQ